MLFIYKATTQTGEPREGTIEAPNMDIAIASLQRQALLVISVEEGDRGTFLSRALSIFDHVSTRDVVILSRQVATLFDAKVPVSSAFKLLAAESESEVLRRVLATVVDDIQAGVPISGAMAKHPNVFSDFYVNMVKSGEESGKLPESFAYLADYLERSYELISKTKNALIYPAFVVVSFVVVITIMLVVVIPRLSQILQETGQTLPIYTRIVIGFSSFLVDYGIFFLALLFIAALFVWRYSLTAIGKETISRLKLSLPYIGSLYRKLYLTRIADNMSTMLGSGISMVRTIEISADVVGDTTYRKILTEATDDVTSGSSVSESFSRHADIPRLMVQMMRIGEETGELGSILKTMADFYKKETNNSVDTLVGLIEPVMIVLLGLGVGFVLTSVLVPIYNITAGI
jgi:type IV pilus assembly protein PilC